MTPKIAAEIEGIRRDDAVSPSVIDHLAEEVVAA
jgi:hypothetical protein